MGMHYLTDDDAAKIRAALDTLSRLSIPLRQAAPVRDPFFTPETYIALTPPSGIPAAKEGATTGTADDRPGAAICHIYKIVDGTGTGGVRYSPIPGLTKTIYNLSKVSEVPGNSRVLVTRDKNGSWIVVEPGGDQTPICIDPYSITYEKMRCELKAGTNNYTWVRYEYLRQWSQDSGGCWNLGPEVLVGKTVTNSCCEKCPDLITGTGTIVPSLCHALPDTLCLTFLRNISSNPGDPPGDPTAGCCGPLAGERLTLIKTPYSAGCYVYPGLITFGNCGGTTGPSAMCRFNVYVCCNPSTGLWYVSLEGGAPEGGGTCCLMGGNQGGLSWPFLPWTSPDGSAVVTSGDCAPSTGTGTGTGTGPSGGDWWCCEFQGACTDATCTTCSGGRQLVCFQSSLIHNVGDTICIPSGGGQYSQYHAISGPWPSNMPDCCS